MLFKNISSRFLLILSVLYASSQLFANPNSATVIAGDVNIDQIKEGSLHIKAADRSIINWESFSISANEITKFIQPDISAAVLNRVVGNSISEIFGRLEANGHVYLINPSGILIGKDAIIDTSSFTASTLDIQDELFLKNKDLIFKGPSKEAVVNYGTIKAATGNVTLLAHFVDNQGTIEAKEGIASIGACQEVILQLDSKDKTFIRIKKEEDSDSSINNSGDITAISVELQTDGNPFSYAIKQEGKITSWGIEEKEGHVYLIAEEGLNATTGTITAKNQDGTGGKVHLLGNKVGLEEKAFIDVSAPKGGGEVLVGGDREGKNEDIYNATAAYMSPEAKILADAIDDGNGGKIIIYSNESTRSHGFLSARGGDNSGDGGFIETSGGFLDLTSQIDTIAPKGEAGQFLIDPWNINIDNAPDNNIAVGIGNVYTPTGAGANISWGTLQGAVAGANTTVRSVASVGADDGRVWIPNGFSWNSAFDLTLETIAADTPNGDVVFEAGILVENTGTGNLIINSGRDFLNNANIELASGDLIITTGRDVITADPIVLNGPGALLTINAGRDITFERNIVNLNLASAMITAGGNVVIGTSGNNAPVGILADGSIDIDTVGGDVILLGGNNAGANSSLHSNVTTVRITNVTGDVTLTAGSADGTYAEIFSTLSTEISNVGGGLTFTAGNSAVTNAELRSNGSININNIAGDITLTGTATNNAMIRAIGNLSIETSSSIIQEQSSTLAVVGVLPGLDLSLIAGQDIKIGEGAATNVTIQNQSTTGETILVCDNLNPASPNIGSAGFTLGSNATITSVGPIRVFTGMRENNDVTGTLNGSSLVPGFDNSATEQWGTYYPSSFGGVPFTFFYKETLLEEEELILDPAKDLLFSALVEMLRELHPFNEYIRRYISFDAIYGKVALRDALDKLSSFEVLSKRTYLIRQKENPASSMQRENSL